MLVIKEVIRAIRVICRKPLITLFTLFTLNTSAQETVNSPYSRYGVGDLQFSGFARDVAMGGIGLGVGSPYNLNIINPASYASLSLTTFEGGVRSTSTGLNTTGESLTANTATFGYFGFGFPIKPGKWGLSFGLVPYSDVGYNISTTDNSTDAGGVLYNDKGSGGLNRFFMGTGFSLLKNLRLGVNASYLFGTINQTRTVVFPDKINYFNTRVTDQTSGGGFNLTFGLQYKRDSLKMSKSDSIINIHRNITALNREISVLKDSIYRYEKRLATNKDQESAKTAITSAKDSIALLNSQIEKQNELKKHVLNKKKKGDWSFNLGGNLSLQSNIHATKTTVAASFTLSQQGFPIIKDTASNDEGIKDLIKIPLAFGFGFTMNKGSQWLFGADVTAQNWSEFTAFGKSDSLVNSLRFAAGAQYTPDDRSIRNYKKVIQYRFGFHYQHTYLQLRSTQLNEYGASIGFGLPLRKTLSVIQLTFEYGKMGTMVNQLVEEHYFKFTLGLTINDLWFVKPRID